MNEHSFIKSIHARLPKDKDRLLVWKINDNFAGGVPDALYVGDGGTLWIEYKYIKLPAKSTTAIKLKITQQQVLWLTRLAAMGQRAWLVIGSEKGCVVLEGAAINDYYSITAADFISRAVDKETLVSNIIAAALK